MTSLLCPVMSFKTITLHEFGQCSRFDSHPGNIILFACWCSVGSFNIYLLKLHIRVWETFVLLFHSFSLSFNTYLFRDQKRVRPLSQKSQRRRKETKRRRARRSETAPAARPARATARTATRTRRRRKTKVSFCYKLLFSLHFCYRFSFLGQVLQLNYEPIPGVRLRCLMSCVTPTTTQDNKSLL